MLSPELVLEIRRLLAEGRLSQRKIAKQLGVSRATVGAIASGKRPDYAPRLPREDEPLRPTGPPRRCPRCGGMVYLPCRLCQVRDIKQRDRDRSRVRRMIAAGDFPPRCHPGK
ncbi:MAG: helix-turn-helix domain-containing protein [Pirellulales bacterium]|nr:helix-turn-helix domain-containing protein [Pirellulales bacterium]